MNLQNVSSLVLDDMIQIFGGDRSAVIARELTKEIRDN